LTAKAYGSFILWMVSANAAKAKDGTTFWSLLREARHHGQIRPVDLLTHVANFSVPRHLLRRVAAWAARRRQAPLSTVTRRDMGR
jgi:hypothetical protein